jgi:hypothetical protein
MPSISVITPSTFDSGRSVTLSGSGFGSAEGQVLIAGLVQNIEFWTDTAIEFTTVRGSQSLGACRVDVVVIGEPVEYPYWVFPISTGGIFDNDTVTNEGAKYRIVSADSESRWTFYDGGGYTFDAVGASVGTYLATYEINNYDGLGNASQATVTVTVTT